MPDVGTETEDKREPVVLNRRGRKTMDFLIRKSRRGSNFTKSKKRRK